MLFLNETHCVCVCVFVCDRDDPHRVVDYRGQSYMAMGSKDRAVHLLYVASETKTVSMMRGHVGSIRAVLLCEEQHLIISAGCDASIRSLRLRGLEFILQIMTMMNDEVDLMLCVFIWQVLVFEDRQVCDGAVWSHRHRQLPGCPR